MSENKVVSRKVAIVLGITAIVLIIGLIGAVMGMNNANATYTDYVSGHNHTDSEYSDMSAQYQNELTTYNNYVSSHTYTNDQYNSAISNYESNHHYTDAQYNTLQTNYQNAQSQISSLNSTVNNLTASVNDLTAIVNLAKQTTWISNQTVPMPKDYYVPLTYSASYAGYVVVQVQSSAGSTYIEMKYSADGVNYDKKITVGTNGTAVFPVLPTSLEIDVGNSELLSAPTAVVTIIYVY